MMTQHQQQELGWEQACLTSSCAAKAESCRQDALPELWGVWQPCLFQHGPSATAAARRVCAKA